jgi:adenylylsulfate kinase
MRDSHKRSFTKALTWRAAATGTTMLLVFAFTGELILASTIGALEAISKIGLYHTHERAWNKLNWGKL